MRTRSNTYYRYPSGNFTNKMFSKWSHMQASPFWIKLDFEAINIHSSDNELSENTRKIFHQECNSFAYAVV